MTTLEGIFPSNVPMMNSISFPAPGQLFINARPWGRVYVDGEFVGNTPQAGLTIAAGVHTIRVVRDGFEPYEAEIEIFSGRQRRITDIVLRPRQP